MAREITQLLKTGFTVEEIRYLSCAQWDSFTRVMQWDELDVQKSRINAARIAQATHSAYMGFVRDIDIRREALIKGLTVDEAKMQENLLDSRLGAPTAPLTSASEHGAMGIGTATASDLSQMPQHIQDMVRRQQELARKQGGSDT